MDTHSPVFRLAATVLATPDPRGLAEFYGELLEWELRESGPEWVRIGPAPDGTGGGDAGVPALCFRLEADHVPPTWPGGPGDQQPQLHLDLAVDDLESGVRRALALGAEQASYQPREGARVLLDPDGHPFRLVVTD